MSIRELSKTRKQGYLVAPSIGITRLEKTITKFGDIHLLMSRRALEDLNAPIYDRDIWSPTFSHIPDKLYEWEPSPFCEQIFSYIEGLEAFMKTKFEENPYRPRKNVYDWVLNESWIYRDSINLITNYRHYSIGNKLKKYYNEKEDEVDYYGFIQTLVDQCIQEISKTPENISSFFKKAFKELRGRDAFAYAYSYASQKISLNDLNLEIEQKLISPEESINFEDLKERQWEILHTFLKTDSFDRQPLAGELLKKGTFNHFQNSFYKGGYRLDVEASLEVLEEHNMTLKDLYELFRKWFSEIPSEYFEVKTLDPIPINSFSKIIYQKNTKTNKILKDLNFKGDTFPYSNNEELSTLLSENAIEFEIAELKGGRLLSKTFLIDNTNT